MRYGDSVSLSRIRNPRQTPVQTLRLDHKRFCEKTKKVKEYKLKWIRAGKIATNDPPNTVPVQYQFATPLSSKDHISEGPFKTVNQST